MELIYNLQEIRTLLIDFYNLTRVRIAIFDKNFCELHAYPTRLSTFCKTLRADPVLNETCKQCDYSAFSSCKRTKQPIVYQCHAGLTEIIVPLQSSDMIIGYLMAGQIYNSQTPYDTWDKVQNLLKESTGLDLGQLKQAYHTRPKIHASKIGSITNMLKICSYYLLKTENISVRKDSLSYQIDQYILNHINEEISVMDLCRHFNYKKTNFHKITTRLYGVSIAKHIRQLRMQYARELLSNTNLKISEIAVKAGINDYNYFTKVFKQDAKCTPREYRKNSFAQINSDQG